VFQLSPLLVLEEPYKDHWSCFPPARTLPPAERALPNRTDQCYRPNAKGTIQEPVRHCAKST
jgi:hypothetical protein